MPAAHEPVGLERPREAQKLPESQLKQETCPAATWYRPDKHDSHAELPEAAEKKPAAQPLHALAPAPEYWPAAQLPETAARPAAEQ